MTEYFTRLGETLAAVCREEGEKIRLLACKMAQVTMADGLIYVFGCGHSHMLAEECFYRAGGLANVCPILEEKLMLHEGGYTSSLLERQNGLAAKILEKYPMQERDMILVVSVSGINAVPVQAAEECVRRGIFTAAIGSGAYACVCSRADSGRHLSEVCDLFIDDHCPQGDACVQAGGIRCAPLSTPVNAAIVNEAVAGAVRLMNGQGFSPPVFVSGNVEGGMQKNKALLEKYSSRIEVLR